MQSNTGKFLSFAVASDNGVLGMQMLTDSMQAHIDDGRIQQLSLGAAGVGHQVYPLGSLVADVLMTPWAYRNPAQARLKPTVNITPSMRAQYAVQLGAAGLLDVTKMSMHTMGCILTVGHAGAEALLAGPPCNYEDASHIFPNAAILTIDQSTWVLGECVLEPHLQNQYRIACGVFCRTYGMGGCICGGVPRCKSLPGVARAIVNGVEA
jgi:hypothetical protein